jgi:Ca-activated chloride channel family protein
MLELAAPAVLLLLPLPWLVRRYAPVVDQQQPTALKVPFFSALQRIAATKTQSFSLSRWRQNLAYGIWALLILAAAGPQWLGQAVHLPQTGRDIMLAVDLSGSMQIPDMSLSGIQSNRLDVVKKIAQRFIQERMGDRLGLILFGSRAYLQTPLTFDRVTVRSMLDDATIGLAGPQTAIGDALGLAIKRLADTPKESRVIVLLTDGGNNSGVIQPLQAAKLAASMGIRIYTIGLGADSLMVPGPFGAQMVNPSSDLDEETLQTIARLKGGSFFRAKDTDALQRAYRELDRLEPVAREQAVFRPVMPLYPWPLGLALLMSVAIGYRRS